MNERFYALPPEKQQAIINAGYRVFSQNSYKNSPMSEIAAEAGISKSLLFHYFHNKKELYLFLWDKCAETTIEFLTRYGCYGQTELFESMERGMRAKMEIIRLYPDMGNFTIKAFYEKDAGISAAIQESYHRYYNLKADKTRLNLDPAQFYTRTGYSYDVSRNVLGFGGLSLGNGAVRQCGYRENGKGFHKTDGLLEKHLSA
ncbi:TetR/AcrR family transcriptional regulator [Holdemanella porci]|uniref:TetR/AcrR family transcriptional regulator n=1 Tax=Holdemanella porci TaxID=2652276 RepID=UPI001E38E1A4|nr:TetR/AcrR family transcriptional regulator [Holdemanella porci]